MLKDFGGTKIVFLKPFLKEHALYATFGKYTDEVIREFLLPDGWQNL